MRVFSADEIAGALTFPTLIEALRTAFRSPVTVPVRHHHKIAKTGEPDAMLLLMPAWADKGYAGIKIVTVVPGNSARGLATVVGSYLLLSVDTGEPMAVMDGRVLTLWRTAAASALAASYLAPTEASHLVMVGAGALASYLIPAHASVRPINRVTIWNRDLGKAEALAAGFNGLINGRPVDVRASSDLAGAVADADIVSAATLSTNPLIEGDWLKSTAHVDLVGGFTPDMREADNRAIVRADVYVDTRAGATHEAGDIVQPIRAGILTDVGIKADLSELCRGQHPGRSGAGITLFKSVGTAVEDLAAAALVYETVR